MPPPAKRNCICYVYDVEGGDETRQMFMKLYSYYWFALDARDDTFLLLLNTQTTNNVLNFQTRGYLNITEVTNARGLKPVLMYNKLNVETGKGDWLESLIVAIEMLKNSDSKGIVTYQIILLSKLLEPSKINISNTKFYKLVEDINELNAYLYIIGPDINFTQMIKSQSDVKMAMVTASFDALVQNGATVKMLVEYVNNMVVCDYKLGYHLVNVYKRPKGKQFWNVPLTIGRNISIPCTTTKYLDSEASLRLKHSKPGQSFAWVEEDDEKKREIPLENVTLGVNLSGRFLPMEDNAMFKQNLPRQFSIIGMTPLKQIPEGYMRDTTYYTTAMDGKGAAPFNALVSVCATREVCPIVRRVYNNGNNPHFLALIPKLSPVRHFVTVTLPAAHEVKCATVEEKPDNEVAVLKEIEDVLQAMSIDRSSATLAPNMMINLRLDKILNAGMKKICGRQVEFSNFTYNPYTCCLVDEELREMWPKRAVPKVPTENLNEDYDPDRSF